MIHIYLINETQKKKSNAKKGKPAKVPKPKQPAKPRGKKGASTGVNQC